LERKVKKKTQKLIPNKSNVKGKIKKNNNNGSKKTKFFFLKKNKAKFDIKIISDEIENKIQLGSSNNKKNKDQI
jgi:hypothetical protein